MEQSTNRLLEMLSTSLGPIGRYLLDPEIIEIMLNPDGKVWIDHIKTGRAYTGIEMPPGNSRQVLELVANNVNTVCTAENPILSAELPGTGSRFQGMLPPIVRQPTFTIRKKAIQVFTLQQYVESGIMTAEQKETIVRAVLDKKNILVVGSTGSGKTTLCNAILAEIATTGDRIVIIEDTQELQCSAQDYVAIRTDNDNENRNTQAALKSTMRLRPDRIVVGEVRGGEALTLLDAWNTGHPGGLCTIHANTALHGLKRIESLCKRAIVGEVDRETIAEAINYAIFITKTATGRKIKEIIEVHGYDGNKYLFSQKNE